MKALACFLVGFVAGVAAQYYLPDTARVLSGLHDRYVAYRDAQTDKAYMQRHAEK